MFGMIGSLLGSVASGLFGMAGQSSANAANQENYATRYQTSVGDMQKAGLNPAAMFGSGQAGVGSPPQMQSTMAAPAAAMKDAASSATAQLIAQKTIDQLTSQIAKQQAETANVKAALGGIQAGSDVSAREAGAIKSIPNRVYVPIVQSGYGADKLKNTNNPVSVAGGLVASAKTVRDNVASQWKESGPLFNIGSERDKALWNSAKSIWNSIPGWRARKPTRETVIYKQ